MVFKIKIKSIKLQNKLNTYVKNILDFIANKSCILCFDYSLDGRTETYFFNQLNKIVLNNIVGYHNVKDSLDLISNYKKDFPSTEVIMKGHDFYSICPETFSYTTAEAISLSYPVACFDMEVQANQVKEYDKGLILSSFETKTIEKK